MLAKKMVNQHRKERVVLKRSPRGVSGKFKIIRYSNENSEEEEEQIPKIDTVVAQSRKKTTYNSRHTYWSLCEVVSKLNHLPWELLDPADNEHSPCKLG